MYHDDGFALEEERNRLRDVDDGYCDGSWDKGKNHR